MDDDAEVFVTDVTSDLLGCMTAELEEAIRALAILNKLFSRETRSAAIGELSECWIAAYTGAERTRRNSRGYDLRKGQETIEVKGRLIGTYGDRLQFNFGKHSVGANIAFCLVWEEAADSSVHLRHGYRISMADMSRRWGTPNQGSYCVRTSLGGLRRHVPIDVAAAPVVERS